MWRRGTSRRGIGGRKAASRRGGSARALTEMLLSHLHELHAAAFHHADGDALLPEAPRPPAAVEGGLVILEALPIDGEAEVHHHRHLLHVDP